MAELSWRSVATWSATILTVNWARSVVTVRSIAIVSVVGDIISIVTTVVVVVRIVVRLSTTTTAEIATIRVATVIASRIAATASRATTTMVSLEMSVGVSILAIAIHDRFSFATILTRVQVRGIFVTCSLIRELRLLLITGDLIDNLLVGGNGRNETLSVITHLRHVLFSHLHRVGNLAGH